MKKTSRWWVYWCDVRHFTGTHAETIEQSETRNSYHACGDKMCIVDILSLDRCEDICTTNPKPKHSPHFDANHKDAKVIFNTKYPTHITHLETEIVTVMSDPIGCKCSKRMQPIVFVTVVLVFLMQSHRVHKRPTTSIVFNKLNLQIYDYISAQGKHSGVLTRH